MNTENKNNNSLENLTVIELCSGIGAQMKGIDNTHLFNANMIATADLDKEVVVSYAAIHCGLTNEMIENYEDYPSKEDMIQQLTDKRLGYDFKKDVPYDWAKLARKKDKTKGIEKYWLADHISHNLGDMMQIEALPYSDMLTYSTPCTDLSIAGKQEGLKWTCQDCGHEYDPSLLDVDTRYTCPNCGSHNIKSTRSGLLYEVERLLVKAKEKNTLPKFLLMENVDALVSKKYIDSFKDWINRLDNLGYNSYYQTINAKNTGIPQNRNRIFCISIRKDIDTKSFTFPQPFDTGSRLKDLLEADVDVLEKYFLSDDVQRRFQITDPNFEKNVVGTTKPEFRTIGQRDLVYQKDSIMGALVATDYKQPKQIIELNEANEIKMVGLLQIKGNEQIRRVYETNGISPTLNTMQGGNRQPKIIKEKTNSNSRIKERFFRQALEVFENSEVEYGDTIDAFNKKLNKSGYSPTLTTRPEGFKTAILPITNDFRIRKLTPKECHRLMGFDDIDYERCKVIGMSDTQGYKQAGNSIVTTVISLLIERLYKAQYDNTYICTDEKMINFHQPQVD